MMIWDFLHIIFNFSIDLILGAGPFLVFKCMGSGSQSGKLLFKTLGDGKNISTIDSGSTLCIQDTMIFDATMPGEMVAVGTGTSIKSSQRFVAQSLGFGGAPSKRGINLPGIGSCNIMKNSRNYAIGQKSLIINSSISTIYDDKDNYLNKNIINSSGSRIGDLIYNETLPPYGSSIKYSSIINSCGGCITKFTSHSTIIGSHKSKIERSSQSSIIGGECGIICDYYRYQSQQACYNFIGGGYNNKIRNSNILADSNYANVKNNSIFSGMSNCISGSLFGSILSGRCNNIEGHETGKGNFTYNLIGGGFKNLIKSYSQKEGCYLTSHSQTIINGKENQICAAYYSLILNGLKNKIVNRYDKNTTGASCLMNSFVINGKYNSITHHFNSGIINGYKNKIYYEKPKPGSSICNNIIVNGSENSICAAQNTVILNGCENSTCGSYGSVILTGEQNTIKLSCYSSIINGTSSTIYSSKYSTIDSGCSCIKIGCHDTIISYGQCNCILQDSGQTGNNSILGGTRNYIRTVGKSGVTRTLYTSVIIGGKCNQICQRTVSCSVGILGGSFNRSSRSSLSGIFGGEQNVLGLLPVDFTGTSTCISSIIGGFRNVIQNSEQHEFKSSTNVIIGGYKNSLLYAKTICNNVVVSGSYLTGRVLDTNGNCKLYCDLTQTEKLSLRGNMYVTDNSGNRCKGLSSLNLSSSKKIDTMCVVKGIIITMSYS